MQNNHWGEPGDVEPMPDWMLAETHRNQNNRPAKGKSLNESIMEAMNKPPVPIIIQEPKNDWR